MASVANVTNGAETEGRNLCFAFVFGLCSGHINPSFPVARALVGMGHRVHYLSREQMRAAVEDTGAELHVDTDVEPELYDGREPDLLGAQGSLQREYGLVGENVFQLKTKLRPIQLELEMPGLLRWLRRIDARAVMYDPSLNPEAACAARVLGIQSIALLTWAGIGGLRNVYADFFVDNVRADTLAWAPRRQAIERLNAAYGMNLMDELDYVAPVGRLDVLRHSLVNLVTTIEEFEDPVPAEVVEAYRAAGARFEGVGPLLETQEGARRAAGHKLPGASDGAAADGHDDDHGEAAGAKVAEEVRRAKASGRRVVLVSMGTVLTGDSDALGWLARGRGGDGAPRGLTGRELCRAAWAGAFDAFGSDRAEDGPLLVVSLGPQADPLGDVAAPANAVCAPMVPQLDVLRAGCDVFLTHGGQNSFMESLAAGVPMLVCPGFGDQVTNASKAVAVGAGLWVPRPDPDAGAEATAAAAYRSAVAAALRQVAAEPRFAAAAAAVAERLRSAGGVPRAVEWMLKAAALSHPGRPLQSKARGEAAAPVEASASEGGSRMAVLVAGA